MEFITQEDHPPASKLITTREKILSSIKIQEEPQIKITLQPIWKRKSHLGQINLETFPRKEDHQHKQIACQICLQKAPAQKLQLDFNREGFNLESTIIKILNIKIIKSLTIGKNQVQILIKELKNIKTGIHFKRVQTYRLEFQLSNKIINYL